MSETVVMPESRPVPGGVWTPASRCWIGGLVLLILACWGFPGVWYTRSSGEKPAFWLAPRTNQIPWQFEAQSVEKSAEALLAADTVFYGEYREQTGKAVRLFTAARLSERPGEIGLFVHTPDRCWTQAGWRIEPVSPDFFEMDVGGARLGMERRIFVHPSGARELVYFFGLVGGQTLPYRLDHNLGVGQRLRAADGLPESRGTWLRAVDQVLWSRVWESFVHRRQLLGAKEFVRISTSVSGMDCEAEDALLRRSIGEILQAKPLAGSAGAVR